MSQRPGDAVVYFGDRLEHWREPFEGTNFAQLFFLNYVRADGERRCYVHDGRKSAFPPAISPLFSSVDTPARQDEPDIVASEGARRDRRGPGPLRRSRRSPERSRAATYRSVHAHKSDKAWETWDGQPMRGESVSLDPHGMFGWKGPTYPTSTSVDLLIDAVRRISADCPDVAGAEGADWVALYLSPWLYPVGSALSLHQDGERVSGAFTFFTHTRWSVHWGGELHVSPEVSPFVAETKSGTGNSAHDTDECLDVR